MNIDIVNTDTPAHWGDLPTTAEVRRANAASSHVTSRFTAGRSITAHASRRCLLAAKCVNVFGKKKDD